LISDDAFYVARRRQTTGAGRFGGVPTKLYNGSIGNSQEGIMNEDMLNMSLRKFLKKVGVTSQREIEEAVRAAVSSGQLKGNKVLSR
jgi:hypothetical protein